MLVNSPRDILRAFSEGYIGWREAARRLNVESFSELESLMQSHGIPRHPRDSAATTARMNALDSLLYGHSGASNDS